MQKHNKVTWKVLHFLEQEPSFVESEKRHKHTHKKIVTRNTTRRDGQILLLSLLQLEQDWKEGKCAPLKKDADGRRLTREGKKKATMTIGTAVETLLWCQEVLWALQKSHTVWKHSRKDC